MRNKTAKRLPPIDTLAMRIRAEIHRSVSCCFLAQRSRDIARAMNKGAAKKLKIGSFRQEACRSARSTRWNARSARVFRLWIQRPWLARIARFDFFTAPRWTRGNLRGVRRPKPTHPGERPALPGERTSQFY